MTRKSAFERAGSPANFVPEHVFDRQGQLLERAGHVVHWRGRQWAVTDAGVEAVDGKYHIEASAIRCDREGRDWIEHMRHQYWVDCEDLAEALEIARRRWAQTH